MHIEEILLTGMLPKVFASESIPVSDVWRNNQAFRRGNYYRVEAVSGGGKSSMCAYIYGARADYEGVLQFAVNNAPGGSRDAASLTMRDAATLSMSEWQALRRSGLAYLPQELSLFPELTAMQNIELKNSLTGHVERGRIEEWLHMLGIDSRRDYPVGRMSIGQQQRVGIIRALCQPFDFILLDEPVSHLDDDNNRIAAGIIRGEANRQNAGIIATSVGNHLMIPDAKIIKI